MRWLVRRSRIGGRIEVPGDKSIGHRSLMLASLASGESTIRNLPSGEDVRSTARCLKDLGVEIHMNGQHATVHSDGALKPPEADLDAGNSGTTTRLLSGILAAQPFRSRLTGDESLRRRPMGRVVEPLTRMGAAIDTDGGRAPLDIRGGNLRGIRYELPVASAQVKSAILLAGLFAEGETAVIEPLPTRDHMERMLRSAGVGVRRDDHTVLLIGGGRPDPLDLEVPGDMSSAAFFLAAAVLTGGEVAVGNVNVNPTRAGFLDVLRRMGATVKISDRHEEAGEPVGTVRVSGTASAPIELTAADIPLLIDEVPLVALLATQAEGRSSIRGARELRVKESDRISSVARGLAALGASVRELDDGFEIDGPSPLRGTRLTSDGDHRLAMMFAVAGLAATGETCVLGAEAAAVSYPEFAPELARLGGRIEPA